MHHEETPQAISWLNKRGITNSVIDAFSITIADVPTLRLHNAIVIPVRNIDGTHAFNKYRRDPMEGNVKPKYLFERGGKVTLFGADKIVAVYPTTTEDWKPKVIITEGELDTLVCWSQNIPAVSSTAGALSFQEDWIQLLTCYEVYICFDNDEAGHKGVLKVLEYLPQAKVIIVPSNIAGVKDISDYVARGGDLHALMGTATQFINEADVEAEKQRLAAVWGNYTLHTMWLENEKSKRMLPTNTTGSLPRSQSDDRLERAKSVDCLSLLPFIRRGRYPVTQCKWHNDNDPSLTYYARNNTCYCHVCGKYADAVDITMVVHGVPFKEALKILLKE